MSYIRFNAQPTNWVPKLDVKEFSIKEILCLIISFFYFYCLKYLIFFSYKKWESGNEAKVKSIVLKKLKYSPWILKSNTVGFQIQPCYDFTHTSSGGWDCRICWLHLCREGRDPTCNECLGYDIKLHIMVRFQSWIFEEYECLFITITTRSIRTWSRNTC